MASSLQTISLVLTRDQIAALRWLAEHQPRQPSLSLMAREVFYEGLKAWREDLPPALNDGQEKEVTHDV